MVAAVALLAALALAPSAHAAPQQYRYVAGTFNGWVAAEGVAFSQSTPVGHPVLNGYFWFPSPKGSFTLEIDDDLAAAGSRVPVVISQSQYGGPSRWRTTCFPVGVRRTISGIPGDYVGITIASPTYFKYPLGSPSDDPHCSATATTGTATVTGAS